MVTPGCIEGPLGLDLGVLWVVVRITQGLTHTSHLLCHWSTFLALKMIFKVEFKEEHNDCRYVSSSLDLAYNQPVVVLGRRGANLPFCVTYSSTTLSMTLLDRKGPGL